MKSRFSSRGVLKDLSAFSYKDRRVVAAQMEKRLFDERRVAAVSRRCVWGFPQAVMCGPLLRGAPFPTTFWLTCPYLARRCGTLESEGGVVALEAALAGREKEYREYSFFYALARLSLLSETETFFLRAYRPKILNVLRSTGVGGIRRSGTTTVKCLHLQTAACLSLAPHPGEAWLRSRLEPFCCKNAFCRTL